MKTSDAAVEHVIKYYQKQGVHLVKAKRGDVGFDLKTPKEDLFIEVKGSANQKVSFRYFENSEYEKARACRRNNLPYEIHIVTGIGTKKRRHYIIPGNVLLDEGRPEIGEQASYNATGKAPNLGRGDYFPLQGLHQVSGLRHAFDQGQI